MKTIIFDLDGTLVFLSPRLVCIANVILLTELRKRYDFALVTGSSKEEVLNALKGCGLTELFDPTLLVTRDDVSDDKASGAPFFEIKKRLTNQMVMIGDSVGDEIGSNKAAIPFVKVKSADELELQRASFEESVSQAVHILETE